MSDPGASVRPQAPVATAAHPRHVQGPVSRQARPDRIRARSIGRYVDDEALAHISPAHSENVNFFGIIDEDVEGELAKLDSAGYRPLRDVWPEQ